MADVFDEWNEGDLESYLIQITAEALATRTTRKPASRSST